MENNAVKKDNRKALPKYLLILLAAAIIGGFMGFAAGWVGHDNISEVIAAVMGTSQQPQFVVRKNGAGNADYYGVIRYAAAVGTCGMILEHSFHTHPRTTAWLLSDENLQRLAEAEAALIAEYYGLEEPEMRYELLKDVKSEFYRPTLEKLLKLDILRGKGGEGEDTILDLGEDAVRLLVLLDRAGLFPAAKG